MYRPTSGTPVPQPHSKSAIDREATHRRLAGKGFGILRTNSDGSTDFYRLLGVASAPAGLRAWYRVSEDELVSEPVVALAAVLISYGGSKLAAPSIEAVIIGDGALELACAGSGYIGVARVEDEIRQLLGMPPRRDGRAS